MSCLKPVLPTVKRFDLGKLRAFFESEAHFWSHKQTIEQVSVL